MEFFWGVAICVLSTVCGFSYCFSKSPGFQGFRGFGFLGFASVSDASRRLLSKIENSRTSTNWAKKQFAPRLL